jgi:hypothetical protein
MRRKTIPTYEQRLREEKRPRKIWRHIRGVVLKNILEAHRQWLELQDERSAGDNRRGIFAEAGKQADLRYADLTGADFRDTDLRYARMEGALFHDVDFTGANLTGAWLDAADLTHAKGLTVAMIRAAHAGTGSSKTALPHDIYEQFIAENRTNVDCYSLQVHPKAQWGCPPRPYKPQIKRVAARSAKDATV